MIEHVPSWWPVAGYALGFLMGATSGVRFRFRFYRRLLGRSRRYGNCVYFPAAPPRAGYRRVYFDMPTQVAECGGPCEAGPEHCDCGALWRDVPIKPQPTGGRLIRVDQEPPLPLLQQPRRGD